MDREEFKQKVIDDTKRFIKYLEEDKTPDDEKIPLDYLVDMYEYIEQCNGFFEY